MTQDEYYNEVEMSLTTSMDVYKFKNDIKQIFAWRIGAEFNKTFDELYVWRRALFLSTNAAKLIKKEPENTIALKAFKVSAEAYEYLSEISEELDKPFCKILSALCYDISGYQANAFCLLTNLVNESQGEFYNVIKAEEFNSELTDENYILKHIQLILLKRIPYAFQITKKSENPNTCEDSIGISLFDQAIYNWYKHILRGGSNSSIEDLRNAYLYYLNKGNAFISHLLHLLVCRFERFSQRSIWHNLYPPDSPYTNIWSKYIRLLANDFYKKFKIKDPKERNSIFEFWISQLQAVQQGVLTSEQSFVVQMPTSAGKTFIAEIAILSTLINNAGKKCIYVAPFRALTNEKETELSHNLSKLGYNVSSLSGSYEIDEYQNFILESTDVLIATPEKLDLLYRLDPVFFESVSVLVIDEGHIIGNLDERSSLLEFLIIRLKSKIENLKTLFISAVMPINDGVNFSKWISKEDDHVISSPRYIDETVWQPTRKIIGQFKWIGDTSSRITYSSINTEEGSKEEAFITNLVEVKYIGRRKFPKKNNKAHAAVALAYKLSDAGNILVFCSRPDWAKSVLKSFLYLFESLNLVNEEIKEIFSENNDSISQYLSKKWLGEEHLITQCLKKNIGIHYGDLPEPLRKAIEQDYKSGVIKILVSTNTIGQGLNFPIKNLIIHSLDINPQKGLRVGVRDFWNIIGRAGRAGKETEGQIIYLSITRNDEIKYEEYINKDNFEKVSSLFAILAKLRLNSVYDQEEFEEGLKYFSEPFILSMMVEEIIGTEDQEIVEKIIGNSLFQFQADDIDLLRIGFKKIITKINERVPNREKIKVYASNGFNLNSNLTLEQFISENIEEIKIAVESNNVNNYLKIVMAAFDIEDLQEVQFDTKLEKLNGTFQSLSNLVTNWIEGKDIDALYETWKPLVDSAIVSKEKFYIFLSTGLTYKIPWGITAFLTHVSDQLNIEIQDFPDDIKSLSSYVKYGLNNDMSCFAMSLGVSNRELAIFVVDKYNGENNFIDFMTWISNLTYSEIQSWNLNNYDFENISEIAIRISTQKFKTQIPFPLTFRIKGTFYFQEAKEISLDVNFGDQLEYERDYSNTNDPYAIKILTEGSFIGFIPREFAKPLSIELDLGNVEYVITVVETSTNYGGYNDIEVSLIEKQY